MFLKKTNIIFFRRASSLCLVFFISFSIFCFGFGTKKIVKANPIVGIFESEVAPIIVNILSSFGVVVSIPTARDFLQEEQKFCEQKALELQNHKGAVTKGIQALQEGYYVSKEFCQDVLDKWDSYCIKKNIDSKRVANSIEYTFPGVCDYFRTGVATPYPKCDSYYNKILSSVNVYIPSSAKNFTVSLKRSKDGKYDYGYLNSYTETFYKGNNPSLFGTSLHFHWDTDARVLNVNGIECIGGVQLDTSGIKVTWGLYDTKPRVSKKVIDNVLQPVNSKNQGLVISPKNVEAIGKVLDPSIPDVPNSSVEIDAPITDYGATVPKIVSGSEVGALPWGMGGQLDNPVDGTDSKPVDKPTDKPVDGTDSKPFDGVLGFLQSILDILKQILAWLQGFFDAFLDFLKKLLVPREGYFVDTFNNFKKNLDGKFGIDTGVINNLKDNSDVADPNFIYKFVILNVPVVLDLSFIKRAVPYCHIFFGGLTAIFLCWFNLKNILFFIRGTSYISPTGDGKGEK